MFDNTERDMAQTLTQMQRLALERSHWDQNEAKERFKNFLSVDRRFDAFDKDALIDRVNECRSNGAVLDLDDPRLRGGEARPLERRWR